MLRMTRKEEPPFSYTLPPDRIAQRPVYPYDQAKLLVLNRKTGAVSDTIFTKLPEFLTPTDLLIFNNTKVIAARLSGKVSERETTVEVLLEERVGGNVWRCLARPMKKLTPGTIIKFSEALEAEVGERTEDNMVLINFGAEKIEGVGQMPIPPYIRRGESDEQDVIDYQPLFSEVEGAVASPTASLHFTKNLIGQIKAVGCELEFVTLHLSSASFRAVWQGGTLSPPASERFEVAVRAVDKIIRCKEEGRRIIAVGTTVVRVLETIAQREGHYSGRTDLFIKPPWEFKLVDGMITNFHQPGTSHMFLVEAFCGRELLEFSYSHALDHDYRFLSYGDGMFVV